VRPPQAAEGSLAPVAGGGGGGGLLGDGGELLEVEPDNGVGEHAGVLRGVALGHVDGVGLDDDAVWAGLELGDGGDGAVVAEAVVAADDAEAEDVAVVVQHLEALRTAGRREARHHGDLAHAADAGAVTGGQRAGAHEVLVPLRVAEAAHDGPHRAHGRRHALRHQRRARRRRRRRRPRRHPPGRERVVLAHGGLQRAHLRLCQRRTQRPLHVRLHALSLSLLGVSSLPLTRSAPISVCVFVGMGLRFVLWWLYQALFSSYQKPKSFQDFSSHRILRHMHEALNIDKK